MKKLFLFMALSVTILSLTSCSNDDDTSQNKIVFKLNGIKKNFNVTVTEVEGLVSVYGYIGSIESPTDEISFDLEDNVGGSDQMIDLTYTNSLGTYIKLDTDTWNSYVVPNTSGNTIKGTFDGSLFSSSASSGDSISITNGSFFVNY